LVKEMVASEAVGGVTPAAVVVIAVLLGLTAVSAAMVDKRRRVGNRHFDL
jgi:hypothetical protein